MLLKPALAVAIVLFWSLSIQAQSTSHVFPQIADGSFSDGTSYKSTIMVLPASETGTPSCSLRFYGLSVTLGTVTSTAFIINFQAGQFFVMPTAANQSFKSGYATLTCTDNVFAQALYSFFAANGTKLSEATVFSSNENTVFRIMMDQRDGARLGVAIANNTDSAHTYQLTIGTRVGTLSIPARSAVPRFVDEILVGGTLPSTAILKIESLDSSMLNVIGLRFTGSAFTTIPAN